METASGKETINVLRRLIAYSGKIFHFSRDIVPHLSDQRRKPRISTAAEDEVEAALRLLARVIPAYPRAFDLVLADAFYAKASFFNFLLARGKHALVVLKEERRHLYQDVAGLFDHVAPQPGRYRSRQCWWGFSGLALLAPGEGPGACHSFPGDLLGTLATRPAERSPKQ